eukprot:TRINITY_DN21313_c0_g1_i3.p1 TRINITY_DN21313_c0_g1~~TRINITY_DN21313_c0_g1_i3.p1  ORF type:complete len:297 (-),score=70.67 TRINITY_DN21313_c0_g1_i3:49-939(-)
MPHGASVPWLPGSGLRRFPESKESPDGAGAGAAKKVTPGHHIWVPTVRPFRGQDSPKELLQRGTSEGEGEQLEDASFTEPSEEVKSLDVPPGSQPSLRPCVTERARAFPDLAELRSKVDQNLLSADLRQSSWEVVQENQRLSEELRSLSAELEDGQVDETWQLEATFWRQETTRLQAEAEAKRERRRQADEAMAEALKSAKAESELRERLHAEVQALYRVQRQLMGLEKEQAFCEAAACEAQRRNETLRQRLDETAVLGRGSGTAHLFVAALPALDAAALEFVQTALDRQMRKMTG